MKWHRLLFWIPLLSFFGVTVGGEGGYWSRESVYRFVIYTALIAAVIMLTDKVLLPRLFRARRYLLFTLAFLASIGVAVGAEFALDTMLLGPPFGGWKSKIVENSAFITPWVLIGLCLLIAENRSNTQVEKTRNELNYLRHQVNPHFLLNTHNNIHFLIESDPRLAADMLLRLSGIMQYMLYECTADRVALSKELQNLVNYIDLEKIRKDPELEVEHNLHNLTQDASIAPLLLISFVENAFKHVSNHKHRGNFIRIEAELQKNTFRFNVTNSKAAARAAESSGIGLQNVKQRLRLLYPKQHTLAINNGDDVYVAQLHLHLK
jgi:hypothetical protein